MGSACCRSDQNKELASEDRVIIDPIDLSKGENYDMIIKETNNPWRSNNELKEYKEKKIVQCHKIDVPNDYKGNVMNCKGVKSKYMNVFRKKKCRNFNLVNYTLSIPSDYLENEIKPRYRTCQERLDNINIIKNRNSNLKTPMKLYGYQGIFRKLKQNQEVKQNQCHDSTPTQIYCNIDSNPTHGAVRSNTKEKKLNKVLMALNELIVKANENLEINHSVH